MASQKQFTVEIRFNEDAVLGTAVQFFQRLVSMMSKFGLPYFREATLSLNYRELARYETSTNLQNEIESYHQEQMREQAIRRNPVDSVDTNEDVN